MDRAASCDVRGDRLIEVGRLEEAADCYREGLVRGAGEAAWHGLARALSMLERYDDADPRFWMERARALLALEPPDPAAALDALDACLEREPRFAAAWRLESTLALRLGRTLEGRTALSRFLALDRSPLERSS